ncbi:MAG: NAD(P)H:quinone oxidoreductase [Corynebacteriales bacterium]|nr:NAD(P)H:quinone oxidoreductase [Mycobacteriales bacterium]
MSEKIKLAIIYYSSTGNIFTMAQRAVAAADEAGAQVRLRKVPELASDEAIAQNEKWVRHRQETKDIPEVSFDDLTWADALLIGSPTRFGLPTAQLKQFMDTTGPLWAQGKLENKIVSSFTSAKTPHGGQESTILAINNVFYHWGCIIVPPGYINSELNKAGNPYGASHVSGGGKTPSETVLNSVGFQAARVVEVAKALKRGGMD